MKKLCTWKLVLILIGTIVGEGNGEEEGSPVRQGRQIRGYRGPFPSHDQTDYPFCTSNNVTGACLNDVVCAAEIGIFMGYCGFSDGVCCDVVKTCGESSESHAIRFQNPSFPNTDTEAQMCSLTIKIGRGICAMRMDHEVFELMKFSGDFCPRDTFTVLGTNKVTSPLCGNMTGWATTFEVDEFSKITLAMILQGDPPYKFSSLLTMLPCKDIISIQSPTNAGIINTDAQVYVTTTTTETPETTTLEEIITTDATTTNEYEIETETETERNDQNPTTPFIPIKREEDEQGPTPLPIGKIRIRPTPEPVEVRALFEDDDGFDLANEHYDNTPNSIFKKIFDAKVGDKCRRYDEPDEDLDYEIPSPEPLVPREGDKCWFYDPITGSYRVNEDCQTDTEQEEEEEQGQFRIIGGKFTNINEYPWQVALIYKKRFFCGGALISDRFVLTASHCVFGSFSSGINDLQVSLGDHDLKTKNETTNLIANVRRVIWHLSYTPGTTANDIGIIELMEPVEFSYSILPINLPTDLSNTYSGQNATVTGWGRNNLKSKRTSSILKEFTSSIDDIDHCVERWTSYPKISAIKEMHVCLNVTYGTPCHGDSGGPLVACNNGARCTLIGIVSFGFPLCRNVGLPTVFTRVTSYKRWIDINTSPLFYYKL